MTTPTRCVHFHGRLNGIVSRFVRRGAHWAPARFRDFRNMMNGKMAGIGTNSPEMVQFRSLFRRAPNGRPYGCIRSMHIFPFNAPLRRTHQGGGVTTSPCRLVKFRKPLKGIMSHTIRRGAHWAPARFRDFRNMMNGKMAGIGTNSPEMVQFRRLFRRAPNGRPYGLHHSTPCGN